MKLKVKRLIASALLAAMCITCTGCGDKDSGTKIKPEGGDVEKSESVESKELEADSVVISVGNETATYKEFLVYMYILKNKYQSSLGDGIWSYEFSDGKNFETIAKEQVISIITEMKVISRKAEEFGIELTGDEIQDITNYTTQLYAGISEEDKAKYMLDIDTITKVYCENEIASKVFDTCINGVDTNISDEAAKQITVQYIYLQTSGTNSSGIDVTLSESEVANRYNEAKKLRKKAKKSNDFGTFAKSNTDAETSEITFGRGDMSEEFTNAAFALAKGELSEVVEAPEGYYIIYCVNDYEEELTMKKKEEIIVQSQEAVFESQYEEWTKEFEIQISNLILQ